jgi:hypothetical protein
MKMKSKISEQKAYILKKAQDLGDYVKMMSAELNHNEINKACIRFGMLINIAQEFYGATFEEQVRNAYYSKGGV